MNMVSEMEKFIVRKEVKINADISKVWDALTNPEMTRKYFFGCRVYSEWKEGSPIEFKDDTGNAVVRGNIIKIKAKKLLEYTVFNLESGLRFNPSDFSIITDELSFDHGITTLLITDDVGNAPGAKERYKKSEKGWASILKGLKKLLEDNGHPGSLN